MNYRVRLLKEHVGNPSGAVMRLPREEALRLHRLGIGYCLDVPPEDTSPVLPTRNQYAKMPQTTEVVLPVVSQPETAPPVSGGRGRKGRPSKA